MPEPDLLLADEPTSSLDLKTSIEILELISRRTSGKHIPAVVSHRATSRLYHSRRFDHVRDESG